MYLTLYLFRFCSYKISISLNFCNILQEFTCQWPELWAGFQAVPVPWLCSEACPRGDVTDVDWVWAQCSYMFWNEDWDSGKLSVSLSLCWLFIILQCFALQFAAALFGMWLTTILYYSVCSHHPPVFIAYICSFHVLLYLSIMIKLVFFLDKWTAENVSSYLHLKAYTHDVFVLDNSVMLLL